MHQVRDLMFANPKGDVCRVADGVVMLVNAVERGDVGPLVSDAVRHLVAGMLGGTLDEAPARGRRFAQELWESSASSVPPAVPPQMRSRSWALTSSISDSSRLRSSAFSSS